MGGEQDETAEGELEETGGLDARVSPSPPATAKRSKKCMKERRLLTDATNPPCLSARVILGESCPATAQPPRRSGGEEVPPPKPGGRGNPWLRPEPGARGAKLERLVVEARGKEERGGKRWWPGAAPRKPSSGIGGLQPFQLQPFSAGTIFSSNNFQLQPFSDTTLFQQYQKHFQQVTTYGFLQVSCSVPITKEFSPAIFGSIYIHPIFKLCLYQLSISDIL